MEYEEKLMYYNVILKLILKKTYKYECLKTAQ